MISVYVTITVFLSLFKTGPSSPLGSLALGPPSVKKNLNPKLQLVGTSRECAIAIQENG